MPNQELSAPSLKAMATVKNKNNIDDINLKRTLTQYEREKALSILVLDHERLDLRDFLKSIKKCASNELPESRHWLQGDLGQVRKCKTPSASGSQEDRAKAAKGRKEEKQEVEKYRPGEEDFDQGVFKTGKPIDQTSKAKVHMDIYSKRNAYASLNWVQDYFDEEGYDLSKKPKDSEESSVMFDMSEGGSVNRRVSDSAISAVAAENLPSTPGHGAMSVSGSKGRSRLTSDAFSRRSDSRYPSAHSDGSGVRHNRADILGLDRSSPDEKPRHPRYGPQAGREGPRYHRGQGRGGARKPFHGDFMKELLVRNAHRRYKKKKRRPFEERLKDFYVKVEELIEKEEELSNAELERKWLLITQGVKAALEESSDEEDPDNQLHTI